MSSVLESGSYCWLTMWTWCREPLWLSYRQGWTNWYMRRR